jgi:MFS family permease
VAARWLNPFSPQLEKPQRPALWSSAFTTLISIQFAYGIAFSSFFALPKYLIESLHADASLVGNAHGAFAIVGVVLVPLIGRALDRFGRRPVLTVGLLTGALSFGPFGLVDSTWAILALRALHGLSFALTFNAGGTMAADLAPVERRAEGIGYFGTGMLITNAIGPALSEAIATTGGWPLAFWTCSAFAALALVLSLRLPKTGSSGQRAPNVNALNLGLFAAYMGSFALGVGVGASKTFVPALLVEAGATSVGPYFLAFTFGAIAQRSIFGWLPDRLGHRRASGVSLFVYGLAMLLVIPLDVTWLPWISLLIGVAHGMGYPAVSALATSLGDAAARGRVTSWLTGGFNLGFAASTAGLAPLEPTFGYAGLVGLGGATLIVTAVLLPWLVVRHERRILEAPKLQHASLS